jgi:hypothetical protein
MFHSAGKRVNFSGFLHIAIKEISSPQKINTNADTAHLVLVPGYIGGRLR